MQRLAGNENWAKLDPTQQAIERAAKLLEPKVQTFSVERSTLHNEQEATLGWVGTRSGLSQP